MKAFVMISLFILISLLIYSKRGQKLLETNGNWLMPSFYFYVVISLFFLAFDFYIPFTFNILTDVVELQSDARRMLTYTLWTMLSIKSLSGNKKDYLISNATLGLLFFSASFQTTMVIIGLFSSFLPNKNKAQKIAKRIMFLCISAVMIVSSLSLNVFKEGDALYILLICFITLLRFNYSYGNEERSVFPALIFALITGISISADYSTGRAFFTSAITLMILGLLLMLYEFVSHRALNLFTLLPSLTILVVSSCYGLHLNSYYFILLPLFWLYMIKEDEDKNTYNKAEKLLYSVMFCTVGLVPFSPGGWSLNMLWSEFITNSYQFINTIPLFLAIVIIISFALSRAYNILTTEIMNAEISSLVISKILSTVVVLALSYYLTIPDIFSDSNAFILLERLNTHLKLSSIPWRSKNLIFLFSILLPVLIFALVFWAQRNFSHLREKTEKYKLNIGGLLKARVSFLDEGLAVRFHNLSITLRNKFELLLKGVMLTPTIFSIEIMAAMGSLLGRMRPKGINSNLLYSIVVISLIIVFYLRLLL